MLIILCLGIFLGCEAEHIHEIELFEDLAKKATVGPGSYQDKTTTHKYQELYGEMLLPYIRKRHKEGKNVKFLEIGMGCANGLHYGAGIDIWKQLFTPKGTAPNVLHFSLRLRS